MGGEKNQQPAYNTAAMERIRKAKGWSPAKWASEASLPRETARNIIRRPKTAVKLDVATRLAQAAGVPLNEIVNNLNSTYSVSSIVDNVETAHHPHVRSTNGRNPGMPNRLARVIKELMEISPAAAMAALDVLAQESPANEAARPPKRGTS